jgi:soluble lytic murein transglycosylase
LSFEKLATKKRGLIFFLKTFPKFIKVSQSRAVKFLFFISLCCCLFVSTTSFAEGKSSAISGKLWHSLSQSDLSYLKKIHQLLEDEKYDEAMVYAKKLRQNIDKSISVNSNSSKISFSESVIDLVLWKKFSAEINPKQTSFSDISRFAIDNPFYSNIAKINRNVERVIVANDISDDSSQQYFKLNPAGTVESKIYAIGSKVNSLSRKKLPVVAKIKEGKSIQNLIAKTWESENLSPKEEAEFLEKYSSQLTDFNHANRLTRLLFDGRNTDAKRLLKILNNDYSRLFEAIIALQKSPRRINRIISSVPRYLRSNEALLYHVALWNKARDNIEELTDLLLDIPSDSKFSEKWWGLRNLYGREMLKTKEYKSAYSLISKHGLATNSSDFWEAEWTSGWIALRFLEKPSLGYGHFEKLYKNVKQPVTLARASYWLGLAAEKDGDNKKAISWYKVAAQYPIFFYGQLAIHKHRMLDPIDARSDIILPKNPYITGRDMAKVAEMRAAQMAYLLMALGEKKEATEIFEWIIHTASTSGQVAVIMEMVNEFDDRQMDAKLSRSAAKKNVFFIEDKFQIVDEVKNDKYAPLVHAIIKQESGFAPTAVSRVGALGFMQLMPETAKLVAREMKIPYNRHKLATDITYNVKLGSFYITKLINRFEGSEMLAIASYNAGPNNTKRWINEFYDPREEDDIDKVVDWIELITYSETRNYVQRIMENLIVYKYLMSRSDYDDVK